MNNEDNVKRIIKLGAKREVVSRESVTPDLNLILNVSPFNTGIPWFTHITPGGPCLSESQENKD